MVAPPSGSRKREIKAYLLYLHQDANRSTSTCNVASAALRFFYHQTLGRSATGFDIPFARKPKKLPFTFSYEYEAGHRGPSSRIACARCVD